MLLKELQYIILFIVYIPRKYKFLFYCRPTEKIITPTISSKHEYQIVLHESYQTVINLIAQQQRLEKERKDIELGVTSNKNEQEDIFANVKKIREDLQTRRKSKVQGLSIIDLYGHNV